MKAWHWWTLLVLFNALVTLPGHSYLWEVVNCLASSCLGAKAMHDYLLLPSTGNPIMRIPQPDVTRVEVIDQNGRSYTYDPRAHPDECAIVSIDYQDNGRTLKVFIESVKR